MTHDDITGLLTELRHSGVFLSFANLLNDDLLGGLSGDATEVVTRLKREDEFLTEYDILLNHAGGLDHDMLLFIKADTTISGTLSFILKLSLFFTFR